jgi:hypothetical protein
MKKNFIAVAVRVVGYFGGIRKAGDYGKREWIGELQNFADGRKIVTEIIDDDRKTRRARGQIRWMRRGGGDVLQDMDDVSALVAAGVFESSAAAVRRCLGAVREVMATSYGVEGRLHGSLFAEIVEDDEDLIVGEVALSAGEICHLWANYDLRLLPGDAPGGVREFLRHRVNFICGEAFFPASREDECERNTRNQKEAASPACENSTA